MISQDVLNMILTVFVPAIVAVAGIVIAWQTEKLRTMREQLSEKKYNAYADAVKIEERVGRGFVELVEGMELDGPHAEAVVRESLEPLIAAGADTIVLGCTHYPFLLPLMQRIAPEGVRFIDPAPAVARHLVDVLNDHGIALSDPDPGVELLSSGSDATLKKLFNLI